MATQDTLYIAEPIFSEQLQGFDANASFPPIKKIGITTGQPDRRERELLGTKSPVKVKIVQAWTKVDAKKVESMLHALLDNTRLDGEYFWDGNESLVDAVTTFMSEHHPEAHKITVQDDSDVVAATQAAQKTNWRRLYAEVIPQLEALAIKHRVLKTTETVSFKLGDYHRLIIEGRSGGMYTFTAHSKTRSTEQAIQDFPSAQECSLHITEDSDRVARIPMSKLDKIMEAIKHYHARLRK